MSEIIEMSEKTYERANWLFKYIAHLESELAESKLKIEDLEQNILWVKSGNVDLNDLVLDIERNRELKSKR